MKESFSGTQTCTQTSNITLRASQKHTKITPAPPTKLKTVHKFHKTTRGLQSKTEPKMSPKSTKPSQNSSRIANQNQILSKYIYINKSAAATDPTPAAD